MTEVVKQVRCWRFSSYCVAPQQCSVLHSVQWPVGLRIGTKSGETEEAVSEWEQIQIAHVAALLQELMEKSW